MEFNIDSFVALLRENMYNKFPYESDWVNYFKHIFGNKNPKPKHIRDVAFKDNETIYVNENIRVFEIGNEYAEKEYPYYHILEDAPVIHKKNKATEKSKGSQAKITDMSKRDYGIINFNGKTFSKEYSRNVRGARASVIDNSSHYVDGKKVNKGASTYKNEHYHYIENMLMEINPLLAQEYDMIYGRTASSGLQEEYISDNYNIGYVSNDTMTEYINQILGM